MRAAVPVSSTGGAFRPASVTDPPPAAPPTREVSSPCRPGVVGVIDPAPFSRVQRQLVGAYFLNEYSFEASALFNPSIVAHPDQSGMADGHLRFVLSLRAVGEGHISSLTFRSGSIAPDGTVKVDPTA